MTTHLRSPAVRAFGFVLLATLALPTAAIGCGGESKAASSSGEGAAAGKSKDEAAAKGPVEAKFGKVHQRKAPREVSLNGTVAGDESSEVATVAAGAVTSVLVDLGSRVK